MLCKSLLAHDKFNFHFLEFTGFFFFFLNISNLQLVKSEDVKSMDMEEQL